MYLNTPKNLCFGLLLGRLVIVVLFFFSLLPIVHSLNFSITYFEPKPTNIVYEGDAKSSSGVIQLNTVENCFLAGRATYSEPLHLWDSASGTLTNFAIRFSFSIVIHNSNHTDDGFAFFLAPVGYPIPPNSAGPYLGLLNDTTRFATSQNQIIMVEFDTCPNVRFPRVWDPPEQHVGININSISSVVKTSWDANSHSGQVADVYISYNATTKNLSASWTYREEEHPVSSSLSHIIDLKEVLPEWVTFGFSASTALYPENHIITSWEFSSNSDARKLGRKKGIKSYVISLIVVAAFFMILMFGMCISRSMMGKIKTNRIANIPLSVNTDLERGALPKRFSHRELVAATDGFANGRKLGQGGSGQVYKGTLSDIDRLVAVKRIVAGSDHSERIFINEVKIISRLIHKNLVHFIGWCHEKDEFLLVYEYMSNGSLDAHLFGNRRTLPWSIRYKIALGLASAIHYLHEDAEQCVLHRDIKSANVLLDADFSTKLGDFGVAKLVDPRLRTQMTGVVGTYGYLAPEYVNGGRASKESDMYSFGVVALEIACGRKTYQNGDYHAPLMRWMWELYLAGNIMEAADERLQMDFDSNEMERLMMVGLWCTCPNEKDRPKAGQVIKVLQLDMPMPELPHDMHDSIILPQQRIDSFQSPVTTSINSVGR
ncbi:L-type lectin-domain containing receptor kinase IX.1 [Ziziphus jujuba]|uniref:L-type lectin-domain containing receptor kinase IX.1 n=1 Tax=Ziziphus jujuba TaxID=326968 RepID=A0A6P4A7I7_ZIZJJ|nr:L-type lectin-domain containing receptor kinase IX.1 [Ziziphus jujuba]